jgi:hypothetical protein
MSKDSASSVEHQHKVAELHKLRQRVAELEEELEGEYAAGATPPGEYYTAYYATTGFMLGMFGAATSLLFNIIGSLIWSQYSGEQLHPLHLIQVYLTFPLGASALQITGGLALAIGCCLYLGTGMVYGILFHLVLTRFTANGTFLQRLVVVSVLSIVVWLVNFYGILAWLQPALFKGNWIVEMVPWWVAMLTHLVFGWTMVLVYPWGLYRPYQVENSPS